MSLTRTLALVALSLLAAGCGSTTKPPERLPGLSYAPSSPTSTVRENDHVFVQSIDGQEVESHFSIGLGSHKTYRQFELPPGKHRFTLLFNENGNPKSLGLGTVGGLRSGGTRDINISLAPRHTYALQSNVSKAYLSFGSLTTANWDPIVTDDADAKTPAK